MPLPVTDKTAGAFVTTTFVDWPGVCPIIGIGGTEPCIQVHQRDVSSGGSCIRVLHTVAGMADDAAVAFMGVMIEPIVEYFVQVVALCAHAKSGVTRRGCTEPGTTEVTPRSGGRCGDRVVAFQDVRIYGAMVAIRATSGTSADELAIRIITVAIGAIDIRSRTERTRTVGAIEIEHERTQAGLGASATARRHHRMV